MNIYLDNAATTKVHDLVMEKIQRICQQNYGNPSSLHVKGLEAEHEITNTKKIIGKILRVEDKELFFTSGGTESNNLAIIGIAKAYNRDGKHIITSAIEHPSVLDTMNYLKDEGYEITIAPVDKNGFIRLDELEKLIRDDTILVSVMHVNNEIGTIQPIEAIGKLIKEKNRNTIFHVDGIQSFGKVELLPKRWLIDCLSISGHKIYAPKGIGALYISKKVKIRPIIFGGHQQLGIRSGTENVPGIGGIGVAAEFMATNMDMNHQHVYKLKKALADGILDNIEDVLVNGLLDEDKCSPYILNLQFKKIKGEVLLHALESKGIYVSTGSACSSNKPGLSNTLVGIGKNNTEIEGSLRFSFSIYNNQEEIDYCVEQLKDIVPRLRKFVRK